MKKAVSLASCPPCEKMIKSTSKGLHPFLRIFLENSSIRGLGKITRHTGVLRLLWVCFVIAMLSLMIYAINGQMHEFTKKHSYLHTTITRDVPSLFPTITICNHNPFSPLAQEKWAANTTVSPNSFTQMIRRSSKSLLDKDRMADANILFNYDQLRLYYENLEPNVSKLLGHSSEELFVYCMVNYGFDSIQYQMGTLKKCRLEAKLVSIPNFFNCYSIEASKDRDSQRISSIMLIIRLNSPNITVFKTNAFYQNIFEQTLGARVQIHDIHELPDMNGKRAINSEPGKLLEINYNLQQWFEIDEMKNCAVDKDHIVDLNVSYKYSYHTCRGRHLNEFIISKCGCMLAYLPRPFMPSNKIPYCGQFNQFRMEDFFRRMKCLGKIDMSAKAKEFSHTCQMMCTTHTYDIRVSTTVWHPRLWQLQWLYDINEKWKILKTRPRNSKDSNIARQHILHYLNKHNSTEPEQVHKNYSSIDSNDCTCILVRRSNNNYLRNQEKLSLNFEGMIGQIGGLCSLTLGLTCAFFVEILEYVYLIVVARHCKTPKKDTPKSEVKEIELEETYPYQVTRV